VSVRLYGRRLSTSTSLPAERRERAGLPAKLAAPPAARDTPRPPC
jgi:hypothetical protein